MISKMSRKRNPPHQTLSRHARLYRRINPELVDRLTGQAANLSTGSLCDIQDKMR